MFYEKTARVMIAAAAATVLGMGTMALAAPQVVYKPVAKKSSVKVDGTSTLHDWTVKSDSISGTASFPGRWNKKGDLRPDLQNKTEQPAFDATIQVKTLTSGESGMDDTMFDAMNKDKFQTITYKLTSATLKDTDPSHGVYRYDTTGDLTVHGVTQKISMVLTVQQLAKERVTISGKTDLKMTQFKIDPPTAMLGMIKSGNKITVTVRWLLQRATPVGKAPATPADAAARQQLSDAVTACEAVGQALAKSDTAAAAKALAKLDEAVKTLANATPQSAGDAWTKDAKAVESSVKAMSGKASTAELRKGFADVSAAIKQMVEQFGHASSSPVLVYRGQSAGGGPGPQWLASGPAVSSPYGAAGQVQLVRICLPGGPSVSTASK